MTNEIKDKSSKLSAAAEKRYSEICTSIRTTDDISFKLLGLVPLLSGAAIVALLKGDIAPTPLLGFVSLFGAVVTFGFYRWELRNIQTCEWLRDRGADIEINDFRLEKGLFAGRSQKEFPAPRLFGVSIGKTNAERIIYTTTIIAWLTLPWLNPLSKLVSH